ncbi:type II CAAX endopeptidase family protein [Bacillus sp. T3]|uniref:CPBP family intramembrane glutamic endopeptidase n=1 Tax=Bacillus sp. T3 TaxID=467262 RepID=UPI002981A036|nr:type II CAAX endopeptidase family protein [Bacillus sp. T3]
MKNRYTELIKDLSDKELLFHLYLTQLILLAISFVLGIILFDHRSTFFSLFNWKDDNILTIGGGVALIVVVIDTLLTKVLPERFYFDGGLNERIFQRRNVFHIAFIAGLVAISEEILFRGVIQTHVGLIISSILFAVIHYRYLFNWFLFINIILLSFLIGYVYELTDNLAVTIFMHFLIDFLLGLMIRLKHDKLERTGRDIHE